jgi:hypothetical protein
MKMRKIKIKKLPKVKIVRNEQPPKKGDLGELNGGWPKSLVAEGKKGLL